MSARPLPRAMTRRQWTVLLAAAAPVAAQVTSTTPPIGAPAPSTPPATPEQRMAKAFGDVKQVGELLSKLEVPMNVEPAFSFRA